MQPSEDGLSEDITYTYATFPDIFDDGLFYKPRKTNDYQNKEQYRSRVTNA